MFKTETTTFRDSERLRHLIESFGIANPSTLPVLKEIFPTELMDYSWAENSHQIEALENACAAVLAHKSGLVRQTEMRKEIVMDLVERDVTSKAIMVLNENGHSAKLFCHSPNKPKHEPFVVRGKNQDWLMQDPEMTNKVIPIEGLAKLALLKEKDFPIFDERVGFAMKPEKSNGEILRKAIAQQATMVARGGIAVAKGALLLASFPFLLFSQDPVLVLSFGPRGYFIEIYRW